MGWLSKKGAVPVNQATTALTDVEKTGGSTGLASVEERALGGILEPFVRASEGLHALVGFPGILIVFGVLALFPALLPIPRYSLQEAAPLALVCLVGSITTYVFERYLQWRAAEAKTTLLTQYTKTLVDGFLGGDVRLEQVNSVVENILVRLIGSPGKETPR